MESVTYCIKECKYMTCFAEYLKNEASKGIEVSDVEMIEHSWNWSQWNDDILFRTLIIFFSNWNSVEILRLKKNETGKVQWFSYCMKTGLSWAYKNILSLQHLFQTNIYFNSRKKKAGILKLYFYTNNFWFPSSGKLRT